MDNTEKAIMIGVGLFITIIIISAVLLIVNLGTGMMDEAGGQISGITGDLKNELYNVYDGKTLSATSVGTAVRKYIKSMGILIDSTNYGKYALTVTGSPKAGGLVSSTKNAATPNLTDALAAIKSERYTSAVILDTNGNVIGLYFKKAI